MNLSMTPYESDQALDIERRRAKRVELASAYRDLLEAAGTDASKLLQGIQNLGGLNDDNRADFAKMNAEELINRINLTIDYLDPSEPKYLHGIKSEESSPEVVEAANEVAVGIHNVAPTESLDDLDRQFLSNLIEAQYDDAAARLNAFDFYTGADKVRPSRIDVLESVLRELGPKEVAVLRVLEEPTLHLEPITSLPRLILGLNNLNYKNIPGQKDVHVGSFDDYHANNIMTNNATRDGCMGKYIVGYRFIITEGAAMPKSNTTYNSPTDKRVDERIEEFEAEYAGTNVKGLTYKGYAMQVLKWQKQGIKGDDYQEVGTYSILNGEASKNGSVASGDWSIDEARFFLSYERLGTDSASARLRPTVSGDIVYLG